MNRNKIYIRTIGERATSTRRYKSFVVSPCGSTQVSYGTKNMTSNIVRHSNFNILSKRYFCNEGIDGGVYKYQEMYSQKIETFSSAINYINAPIHGRMINPEIKVKESNMQYYIHGDGGFESENHYGGIYKSLSNGYYIYFGTISKTNLATKDHYSLLRLLELRSLIIHSSGSKYLVNEIMSSLSYINRNASERILLFNQINMKLNDTTHKPFYIES